MSIDGGGWSVVQRRQGGKTSFNRNWTEYEKGFGDMTGEFWLGLEKIRRITAAKVHDMRIDLVQRNESGEEVTHHVQYTNFKLGDKTQNYTLSVGQMFNSSGKILICLL